MKQVADPAAGDGQRTNRHVLADDTAVADDGNGEAFEDTLTLGLLEGEDVDGGVGDFAGELHDLSCLGLFR